MAKQLFLIEQIAKILNATKSEQEMRILLEALLTPMEIEEIYTRWHLLCRLHEGQTQREIASDLGVSLGKIARGSRMLKYGSEEFNQLFEQLYNNLNEQIEKFTP